MNTNKSPDTTKKSPSKKKLTQARLPFKILSDVSPKTPTSTMRKRKLSSPEPEVVVKVGKISDENNSAVDLVLISDDDSKDAQKPQKVDKSLNPYVKLVDTAWKKKFQKSKTAKRKKISKKSSKNCHNSSVESINARGTDDEKESLEIEMMDLSNQKEDDDIENSHIGNSNKLLKSKSNNSLDQSVNTTSNTDNTKTCDVVVLEDSSNSVDINPLVPINKETALSEIHENKEEKTEKTAFELQEDIEMDERSAHNNDLKESHSQQNTETLIDNLSTPKRSARIKGKEEEKNSLNTSTSSKLNESVSSDPTTPNQNRSSSVNSIGDESMNELTPSSKLTPKQLQKKLESAKKREEREKEKQERERKRQAEKEEKMKQKQEKEEQKRREREEKEEAKKKEKEEKEEQRRKEKEEKERQRELERKLKEEKEEQKKKEREEKEEQRRKEKEAREEEKRKKQEALEQEKIEQELKKKKAAEAFVNFFVPKQKTEKDQFSMESVSKNTMLSSFNIKIDMRLAPIIRVNLSKEQIQALDNIIKEQNSPENDLYLKRLKGGIVKPGSMGKTWPLSEKDDEVMIIEDELPPLEGIGEIITCESTTREKLRPKLFSFHDNRRPPYWGTWRKKSSFIKPRRPFGQDEKQLDYEVDSDDEWEEEQEGESIDGSAAGSDDEQEADDYEVDNEVFVPHGYLSDEEATMDEDDVLSLSPETQKARLKYLEDEFESELKKPTEKLKPRVYGLIWETKEGGKPENCVDALWNYFGKLAVVMNDPTPLLQPSNEPEEIEKKKVKKKKITLEGDHQSPKSEKKEKSEKKKKKVIPQSKKNIPEVKKKQPGINTFLTKLNSLQS